MRRLIIVAACALALVAPAAAQAATGTVEGTVTPLEWAQEVEVCVVEALPSETCAEPTANGSYALFEVPLGGARIEFVPSFRSRLLTQFYKGVSRLSEAQTVVFSPEVRVVKGIDAALVEGGAITGTVTAAVGGAPLPEVEVCAVSSGTAPVKSCGVTDAAGDYELHSLPTGSYGVGFSGSGASAEYEPSRRQGVGVSAGGTTPGVDASLTVGAQIRGVVSAGTNGARLEGISTCLFAVAAPTPQRCTFSDAAGEYAFEGLPSGSYQVGFSLGSAELGGESGIGEDGFASQYYDLVGSRAEAAVISLAAPQVVGGVDAVLSAPQALPAPAPAPSVAAPTVPAPAVIAVPTPKAAACKKPKRKQKVKGKVRCVKPAKTKKKHKKKTPPHKHKKKATSKVLPVG
jgi:hypothetical protein